MDSNPTPILDQIASRQDPELLQIQRINRSQDSRGRRKRGKIVRVFMARTAERKKDGTREKGKEVSHKIQVLLFYLVIIMQELSRYIVSYRILKGNHLVRKHIFAMRTFVRCTHIRQVRLRQSLYIRREKLRRIVSDKTESRYAHRSERCKSDENLFHTFHNC